MVATSDATLWAMDRETFRTILLQMMCQKRMRFEALLETYAACLGASVTPRDPSTSRSA